MGDLDQQKRKSTLNIKGLSRIVSCESATGYSPQGQPCSYLSYLVKPQSTKDFVYQAASNSSLFKIRYELPQPTANQKHDITSWTEAVDNSMAQLEHQAER